MAEFWQSPLGRNSSPAVIERSAILGRSGLGVDFRGGRVPPCAKTRLFSERRYDVVPYVHVHLSLRPSWICYWHLERSGSCYTSLCSSMPPYGFGESLHLDFPVKTSSAPLLTRNDDHREFCAEVRSSMGFFPLWVDNWPSVSGQVGQHPPEGRRGSFPNYFTSSFDIVTRRGPAMSAGCVRSPTMARWRMRKEALSLGTRATGTGQPEHSANISETDHVRAGRETIRLTYRYAIQVGAQKEDTERARSEMRNSASDNSNILMR